VIYQLIVLGASFGGFDALKTLLGTLPSHFPVPLVVVQHQSSPGTGLATLLQRYSALAVREAEDKEEIQPGTVYLAPPGYHLLVERGSLALSVDPPVEHARPSIDVLFESAADAYGPEVVGVILTGTGRDGAAGLARIKRRGGMAIVQDPATARRAAMPEAALASTPVDLVLPIERIGRWLVQLQHYPRADGASQHQTPEPLAPESRLTRI
jgi:two-component system chemotaxis response regulator CheB